MIGREKAKLVNYTAFMSLSRKHKLENFLGISNKIRIYGTVFDSYLGNEVRTFVFIATIR